MKILVCCSTRLSLWISINTVFFFESAHWVVFNIGNRSDLFENIWEASERNHLQHLLIYNVSYLDSIFSQHVGAWVRFPTTMQVWMKHIAEIKTFEINQRNLKDLKHSGPKNVNCGFFGFSMKQDTLSETFLEQQSFESDLYIASYFESGTSHVRFPVKTFTRYRFLNQFF